MSADEVFSTLTGTGEAGTGDLRKVVDAAGGWVEVFAAWRAAGGERAVLADVWETRQVIAGEAEAVAEAMGVDEALVRRSVHAMEEAVTRGDVASAAETAAWFAGVFAAHFRRTGAGSGATAWWESRWERLARADGENASNPG